VHTSFLGFVALFSPGHGRDTESPVERQRRYHQVAALGNSIPPPQTEVHLQAQLVASPEAGVDDDLHEEDPRVIEAHSRIDDLTDYLWSIPGFEGYCTALADAAQVDADSYEREGVADSDVDVASVEAIPDDLIEAWLDDQVEDWLDVYTGFQDACCQDAFDDNGCSGDGCSGDDDDGCQGARVSGLRSRLMDTLTTVMRRTLFITAMRRTLFNTALKRTPITNSSWGRPCTLILRHPFRRYSLQLDT